MDSNTKDDGQVNPSRLRVNYRDTPNNLTLEAPPRFSWSVENASWGRKQTAYRIRLARSRESLTDGRILWDTGRVDSGRSTDVQYGGPSLAPDSTYYWSVKVWNERNDDSAQSDPAEFSTAPDEIRSAEWITFQSDRGDSNGHRSRWRAPEDDPTEWVQIDLGAERKFERIELYPTEPFTGATTPDGQSITANTTEDEYSDATTAQGPVAFGFPDRYRVEVSSDSSFEDGRTIVDVSESAGRESRREPQIHEVDAATARYVRVVATDLDVVGGRSDQLREEFRPWAVFALAALGIRDSNGIDLARDRPVAASSAVESETWGRSRLTDGEYAATMNGQSPLFRTEFELTKPVSRARVHFTGVGYGELYLNGENVGEDVLNPGWTQYDRRVLYSTYDVTNELEAGVNAVGIWLGRGWFGRSARQWTAFGSPRALLRMTVEYADGTTKTIVSDGDWRASRSPIVENDIYLGETYDAQREQRGWAESHFNNESWKSAAVTPPPEGDLYPQQVQAITVTDTLEPVEILPHEDGPIVDFGQNHTGWLLLDIDGAEQGDEIVLRHAEALDADGGLRTIDLRSADATDTYVVGDSGTVTYEPRFTYHGYRYAQIEGYPGELASGDVRSKVVHTGMEQTGEFACSNDDLTAVQQNAQWGLRSNAHSVPTDCPQRDERMGFTGDGHIAARALHYNFDSVRFHEKWMRDHRDTQSPHGYVPSKCPFGAPPALTDPTWTVSMLAIPWHLYRFYGDEAILKHHYEAMCRYVDFWESISEDDLLPESYSVFGDWVALEYTDDADSRRGLPTELFTDAYYYRSLDLAAKIASTLGCEADAAHYRERADAVAEAFNERYFDAERSAYESGTQAANALPVFFGITPEERAEAVVANLAQKVTDEDDGQLRTGFLGTRPLLAVLTEYGYGDLAYRIVRQPEYPGWVYMLRQGATTVWERWNSDSDEHSDDTGSMNSLNHSPFTCISEWFFDSLAGIDVNLAAEEHQIEIAPTVVGDLSWTTGTMEVPHGKVESRWETTDDGYTLAVQIPWNTSARVTLPPWDGSTVRVDGGRVRSDGETVAEGPEAVTEVSVEGDETVLEIDAGSHRIDVE